MVRWMSLLLLSMTLVVVGCSAENERKVALRRTNLEKVGAGYRSFHDEHGRGPSGVEALCEHMLAQSSDDAAVQAAGRLAVRSSGSRSAHEQHAGDSVPLVALPAVIGGGRRRSPMRSVTSIHVG